MRTINRRWISSSSKIGMVKEPSIGDTNPMELLFTKYLQKEKAKPITPPTFELVERTREYKLPRSFYAQLLQSNPMGSISNHVYKGLQITIVPNNYARKTPVPQLYKLLQKEEPDLVMMQLRPDKLLSGFQLIKKKGDAFSDSLYWKQICRKGYDAMPSSQQRQRVAAALKRSGIRLKPLQGQHKQEYDMQTYKSPRPYNSIETLTTEAIATASFYSEWNNVPTVLCQLPQTSQRQYLANSLTLMELQLLFRQTCEQLLMYPPSTTPRQLAQYLFPEVLLHYSERYMATLLEYIAAVGKFKKIVMLTGLLQAEAVPMYLKNRSVGTILADLIPPAPKGSIMRDITGHEVIEKHCLLDVLHYGQTLPNVHLADLSTTNNVVNFYLGGSSPEADTFRSDMYNRYLQILKECLISGQRLKQQQFIRNVL